MATTENTETVEERLVRLEAELARANARANLREGPPPIPVPPPSGVLTSGFTHAADEQRAARLAAAERERERQEAWARANRSKIEKRDAQLRELDGAMAAISEERARLSEQWGELMRRRTALAATLQPPTGVLS
jgi:DNA repair exonuclease SbcCD ATPase subunit